MKKLLILCLAALMTFLACNGSTPEATNPWKEGIIYAGLSIDKIDDLDDTITDEDYETVDPTHLVPIYVSIEKEDILFGDDSDNIQSIKSNYPDAEWKFENTDTKWSLKAEGVKVEGITIDIEATCVRNDDGTIEFNLIFTTPSTGEEVFRKEATMIEFGSDVVSASWQAAGTINDARLNERAGTYDYSANNGSYPGYYVSFTENDILFGPNADSIESLKEKYPDVTFTIFGTDTELNMWCSPFESVIELDSGDKKQATIAYHIIATKADDGTITCEIYYYYDYEGLGI